jgi:CBS domain-containing protein
MQVSDMMTCSPVVITSDVSVKEVKETFEKHHVRHLPVVDDEGSLVGIISQTDLNRLIFGAFMPGDSKYDDSMMDMLTLDDIMIRQPVTMAPDQSLEDVVAVFTDGGFHAVPVVEGGNLVGILSVVDVLKHLYQKVEEIR